MFNVYKRKMILLYAVIAFFWMSLYAYQPLLSSYCSVMGAGAVMVGNILGSYGLVQLILRIPLGILSDRIGRRKLFLVSGCAISAFSSLGLYFSLSPGWLLIFRGMAGVAASTWAMLLVLFSGCFPHERAPEASARAMVCNNLGQVTAMFLGGQIGQYFGDRQSFLLAAVFAFAALACSLFIIEERSGKPPLKVKELFAVGKDRTLLLVSFLAIAYQMVNQGATMGFTPQYASVLGASSSQKGILTAMAVLGSAAASYCAGEWLLARFGRRKCILAGEVIAGAAVVAIALAARSVRDVYILQFLTGWGNGLSFPLLMGSAIKGIPDEKRGAAMSFFQSIYALGMYLGPFAAGLLIEQTSLRVSLACLGCINFAAFIVASVTLEKDA